MAKNEHIVEWLFDSEATAAEMAWKPGPTRDAWVDDPKDDHDGGLSGFTGEDRVVLRLIDVFDRGEFRGKADARIFAMPKKAAVELAVKLLRAAAEA